MKFFDYPEGDAGADEQDGIAFLSDILEEDWVTIARFSNTKHFSPGDQIVKMGDKDDGVYIIVEGSFEVLSSGAFGRQKVVAEIGEGSVFGEVSFFGELPRTAGVRAQSSGTAIHLTRSGFDKLFAWSPSLGRKILLDLGKIMAYRFQTMTPNGI